MIIKTDSKLVGSPNYKNLHRLRWELFWNIPRTVVISAETQASRYVTNTEAGGLEVFFVSRLYSTFGSAWCWNFQQQQAIATNGKFCISWSGTIA